MKAFLKQLMLSDKLLERTEEGNQERHGEIYAEAVENGFFQAEDGIRDECG